MAPTASKKGTGAKPPPRDRRSSSRHSTPVSALTETAPSTPTYAEPVRQPTTSPAAKNIPKETPYLKTPAAPLLNPDPSVEDVISRKTVANPKNEPPTAATLLALHDTYRDSVAKLFLRRGEVADRAMRKLADRRKERLQQEREAEAERVESARIKREEMESEERKRAKKASLKRSREEAEGEEERARERRASQSIPSVGAHGLARQDGVGTHEGVPAPPSPPVQPGNVAIDPLDTAETPDSDTSHHQPAPMYEAAFGKDPSTFDDPTVYDITPITDDMSYEERLERTKVAQMPDSDLHELTAGTPPDMDFSNAKPANQINFSTFQTYIEPFIRALTEEDVAFLKERGDRLTPYIIPQRGTKHYKELWAQEDGLTGVEPPHQNDLNPNEPRGRMEDMTDDLAETDEISMGPVMSRLLSVIRPAPSSTNKDDLDTNGDTTMTNGDIDPAPNSDETQPPTTRLPTDAPRPQDLPPLDYDTFEQRALQELRHIGFLAPTDAPSYPSRNDDEVSARLRTLQAELRRVSRLNGVRKARVLELTEERMAMQEYANISDDLDAQVNTAYLKRNRSLAKPASKKGASYRPGQKGVAGVVGGRGVSDGVRLLMQKRRDWIDMVGPVVGFGRPRVVGVDETVFDEGALRRFERAEREAEAGDGEGE